MQLSSEMHDLEADGNVCKDPKQVIIKRQETESIGGLQS